jgi:hypothetical protein
MKLSKIRKLFAAGIWFITAVVLLCFVAGCATPIGVVRGNTQDIHYALTANVLSAGEPSAGRIRFSDARTFTSAFTKITKPQSNNCAKLI